MPAASTIELSDALRRARTRGLGAARRHRCFISYHQEEADLVEEFVSRYGHVFLPTALGVTCDADFIDSEDENYIKRRIRELHLASTTVTIVFIGKCTWSRQFIDWEIAASLRDAAGNRRSGLLAIALPGTTEARLPDRIADNWVPGRAQQSYAEFRPYPESAQELRTAIEAAFSARRTKAPLVNNSRPLRRRNSRCS